VLDPQRFAYLNHDIDDELRGVVRDNLVVIANVNIDDLLVVELNHDIEFGEGTRGETVEITKGYLTRQPRRSRTWVLSRLVGDIHYLPRLLRLSDLILRA
jgi:hypothetical protein